ncbi:hypothetical protein MPTK1_5g20400 [Marchantia polymorpha subsp. ruderalis]|uniref:Protein kinase domain-containing protein n=2 Tax=Marchantia polymorpha TaxID=3197 RepID=A0AAF6BKE0_MARPO|nr:hypothetical protein MARPO_0058s0018 [Marchantia polymorpha]BAF79948.1 receptor-like kinase [Marchantia polymorpha]BBN12474.1 hypothetical protein Mp_5g20400 [Marchantia polymorpha subsp. ruderalis]|eukprot:PTQ37226.1 hypothetical protein MARPO_0058s0018 [Marchantia polymorpha]
MVASTIEGVRTVLVVVTVVLTAYLGAGFAVTVPTDVTALKALQAAWGSGGASLNWAGDPCDNGWTGVLCDPTNTRVISLSLDSSNLVGVIPPDIGGLANLQTLELSVNPGLTGSLPTQIGDLTNLQTLSMQFCAFTGELPSEIGNLANLNFIGVNGNNLNGSLPDTLGKLDKLVWLDISQNQFTGSLPVSSTSASSIGLDNLTLVQHFHFNNNTLTGTIPPEIFSLPKLIHLILDHNLFEGQIPTEVENSPNLTIIRLDSNNLDGPVPSELSKVTTLTDINLGSNKLSGVLPDLSNLTSLQSLDVGDNQMGPQSFPEWVLGFPSLTTLYLSNGGITGELNATVLTLPSLETLDLRNNQISGSLTFTGAVSNALSALILDNNNIDGFVGQPLQSGDKTFVISLYNNPLCSNKYIEPKGLLCEPYDSSNVYLPPSQTCSSSCDKNKKFNPRMCSCGYPQEVILLLTASFISFDNTTRMTDLETELAAAITNVTRYDVTLTPGQVYIYNASNTMDKRIKLEIWFFAAVGDKLTAAEQDGITYSMRQHLFTLKEGPYTLQVESFSDNPGKTHLGPIAIAMIALGAFVAAVIIIILAVYAQWQKRNAETADNPFRDWPGSDPEKKHGAAPRLKSARRFPLVELKAATKNWSEVLGEGGYGKVYKGTLKDGEEVAIKRANKDSMQGLSEFKNELELLSRVHHRNLVDLIGFCYEGGEQALVYEFMSNGTFRELLYERPGEPLSWQMRVDIILNSARGLAYLHDHASPPIIHGDIKTANILLNQKFLAKVADFGLSKPTAEEERALYASEVRGTRGYLDPEYYQTYVHTFKSDVFSFGVVMIEALTAQSPTHGGKDNTREFRNGLEHGGWSALRPLLDPNLDAIPNKELEAYIGIALRCVEHRGEGRPTMTEVVKELEVFASGGSNPNSGVHRVDIPGSKSPEIYSDTVSLVKDPKKSNEKSGKDVDSSSFQYSGAYGVTTTITPK